ncbi:MAG: alpha/beta hydrolase [Synergistaceae bacterium]|nr:alpha/beta hydrolase [Synergistaceae bacterium]
MKYNRISIDGLNIFYRTAGDPAKPAMLLLHGFPSASHMFRDLMPMLEDKFYLVAPDYPGFGQSDMPSRGEFTYTFDNLAEVVDGFISALNISKFYMYVFDYGAPIGFRIAMKHPSSILGIISQNGNVYAEGRGKKWEARAEYWAHPTPELREQYKSAFAPETIIGQYTFGTEEGSVSPDGYTLDIHYTQRPGYDEIQSDLIYDYQNNVKLYPKFQEYLRTYKPKLLAVWGKNDPSFIPAGAEAFRRDVPDAQIHFVNSGHFALESCCKEIAGLIRQFSA